MPPRRLPIYAAVMQRGFNEVVLLDQAQFRAVLVAEDRATGQLLDALAL
jgi:hypothetical protein